MFVKQDQDTPRAAEEALALRDEALAALDEGDLPAALDAAGRGLAVLETAGLRGREYEAALLVVRAEIEEDAGRPRDARVTVTAAIAMLGDAPPSHDTGTLLSWCQAQERLAGLERLEGDFGAAAGRLRRVLDAARAAFGDGSMAVVSAANALGAVHKFAADFDAAEAAYRRAVAAAEAVTGRDPLIEAGLPHNLGAVHPDVARDLNALGALYHLAGRYGDADWAYRRALAAFEYCYGPDHVEIAMTCANLAVLDGDLGRFREAEALGRRALAIQQDVLGPGDTEVGLTLLNLAAAVAGQGRAGEATVLTVRAAAILGARRPADRPHAQVAAEALRAGGRRS